ncbi:MULTISPECIES: hypothetical protein [Mangrovimonas]|uniref:hypothetical protein n=1 Tax=Mangrovimonas TaxID=1211036 RepID=UPI001421EDE6|nr:MULTISPECIES: hypothetical protein [Mangrovimonas]MCF1422012.1 hypothetical protein [Mangrovimonas futianensis]NIK91850.1 hypothetical protein [Mangrovimonas sp. CR14]
MKKTSLLILFFFTVFISFSQETAYDLKDLVDMRASSLDNEMGNRGYDWIKTEKSGYNSYQNWWNNRKNKCVTVRVSDGKVKSIVNVPDLDCNKSRGNQNHSNNRGEFHHSNDNERNHDNYQTYVNGPATSVYRKLQDDNFKEVKVFQKDGYTYKLWYKYRTKECLKTVSYDYKLTKILFSHHCDENL